MTLADYARRRGVSKMAVSKAVKAGRLVESITRDERGTPAIADPELADREWERNTAAPVAGQTLPPPMNLRPPAPPAPAYMAPVLELRTDVPDFNTSRALRAAAAARREIALADQAELDLQERRGELVSAEASRADVIAAFSLVKTKLLAVPSQVAQRLPELAIQVEPVVDELIRDALEELSRGDGDRGDDAE